MTREIQAVRIRVEGRVQGVGFRNALQEYASGIGLQGYVRNRADGSVEAQAVGTAEQIDALVRWCHVGPPMASPTHVVVDRMEEIPHYSSFTRL